MVRNSISWLFVFVLLLAEPASADSLTGHWTMDDNTPNTTVADSTDNNYDGTFSDSTNPDTGYHHSDYRRAGTGSLTFDGTDDYVTIDRSSVLEIGNASTHELSVSVWVKSNHTGAPTYYNTIVGTGDGGWYLGNFSSQDTPVFACWLVNGASSEIAVATNTTPIFDGQWHHVTGIFDGSSVHLYVDGTSGQRPSVGGTIMNIFNYPVLIGENGGATGRHWNGLIDDVKIYDYALSPEEIYSPEDSEYSWNPSPPNGAAGVDINDNLSFTAGSKAISHDVYFGTSQTAVASAGRLAGDVNGSGSVNITDLTVLAQQWLIAPVEPYADLNDDDDVNLTDFAVISADWLDSADSVYKGNQTATTFDPGSLAHGTTYYWRVDEVNNAEPDSPWKGDLWNFTTFTPLRDLYADTWVATDALGRQLPDYSESGPPRSDRYVALFYFLWLGQHGTSGPYDITKLLAANPTDPAWGPEGRFHHWGQSELGYYLSDDEYVMRNHAHMLANAGVDVIVVDVTNGYTYKNNYMTLCSVFMDIRNAGGKTPQIAFMANTYGDTVVQTLYDNLYSKNLYPELWFYFKGKPLVLTPLTGDWADHSQQVRDFFTMRYSWAWTGDYDTWNWIDDYPQKYGWHDSSSIPEETSVCVGHHPTTNKGRSYQNGSQPGHDIYGLTGSENLGLNFAEQWTRLNQIEPELLFITGWNEWVAQRQINDIQGRLFLGQPLAVGDSYFVDAYNHQFSRDIEPMKGGHTDNYYYQMIDGIRKYKGIRQPQAPSAATTITIDGSFTDWDGVGPEYRDWVNDTTHRNSIGWGAAGVYTNTTGRNDFITARVARDDTCVYFYIETADNITPCADPNWMMLFINADQDYDDGWEGYDYVINMSVNSAASTTLKTTTGGWNWTNVNADISYQVSGSKMEIRIPRGDIGQGSGSDPVAFDFHLSDNIQTADDIIEFSVSGDSAPDRRFNYRY